MSRQLNILFTCVGRRVVLLESFRRAMKELGIEGKIFATDVTQAAAALHVSDKQFIVPRAGNIQYMPALEKIIEQHRVGLVIPLTDLDLRTLARRRDRLADSGCAVMIGPEETIKICRDKRLFSQHLRKAGMPSIRTFPLPQFRQKPFYPCFVKPLRGSAGLGTAKINSERELQAHMHVFGDQLLVQDYVPGREYTVDVYRTRSGEIKSIIPRQRLVVRSGEVDQGITIHDEELFEETRKLVSLMDGLWGVFCCQCRRPEGKPPHFFEINPRFGGGAPLSIAAGADLPKYLLQEILGMDVQAEVGKFTPNLLMLRYSEHITKTVDDPSSLPGYDNAVFK
ncbi:MAG: ATP-grasp domain-containing protein [Phycisphaerae bacterium]|nr:ATP-grasp domain-containing protein [Phycisphaerae bacterium]